MIHILPQTDKDSFKKGFELQRLTKLLTCHGKIVMMIKSVPSGAINNL